MASLNATLRVSSYAVDYVIAAYAADPFLDASIYIALLKLLLSFIILLLLFPNI